MHAVFLSVSIILPRYIWVNVTNGNGWTLEQKRVDYYNVYVAALSKPTDHKVIVEPACMQKNK